MFLYFLITGLLIWNSAQAITEKDLPKYPKKVQLNRNLDEKKEEAIQSQDPLLDSIKGEVGKDLNLIPWKEQEEKPALAPGLKNHKKKSPEPVQDKPIPPLILKGLVLFGSQELVCGKDLSLFSGFETIGLPDQLIDPSLDQKIKPYYCKKQFNYETVESIITFLEKYYLDHELGIVNVSIPIQDISSQVLSLVVKIAHVDLVKIEGNRYLSDEYILDEIPIVSEEVIGLEENNKNVAFFNLNPMQKAAITYPYRGIEGRRDVMIQVGDRYPLRAYFGIDNQGLQLLGPFRSFYGFNYANLFGSSDMLSFQFTTSADLNRYRSFTGDYKAFISPYLILNFFGGYARDIYEKGDEKNQQGFTSQGSLRINVPWHLKQHVDLFFAIGADFKSANNNLEYIEYDTRFSKTISLTQLVASLDSNWNTKHLEGGFHINGFLSLGDIFGTATYKRYQELRLGAQPFFSYVKASLSNIFYVYKSAGIKIRAEGQLASTNLLPSEEFAIGGLKNVRGYIENAGVGDQGYFASGELLLPSFSVIRPRVSRTGNPIEDKLSISGFFDIGKVYAKSFYQEDARTQPKSTYLMSAGPHFNYNLDDYLSVDVNVGFKLKKTPTDPTSTCRANCEMTVKF